MPAARTRRRITLTEPGQAHFLTYKCFRDFALLRSEQAREWVVQAINVARKRHGFEIYAYVIMPNHVHLLVRAKRDEYDMSRFLHDLKRPVSWRAKRQLVSRQDAKWLERLTVKRGSRTVFRFWQRGGGYDRNIVSPAVVRRTIDYMHANPVRKELVASPEDWRWSSAGFWLGIEDVPLRMDSPPL